MLGVIRRGRKKNEEIMQKTRFTWTLCEKDAMQIRTDCQQGPPVRSRGRQGKTRINNITQDLSNINLETEEEI